MNDTEYEAPSNERRKGIGSRLPTVNWPVFIAMLVWAALVFALIYWLTTSLVARVIRVHGVPLYWGVERDAADRSS